MAQVKGILGTKLGMTQIFDETRAVPVTVIQAGPCVVAQVKTEARDGYRAVQLAFGDTRSRSVNKPMRGHRRPLFNRCWSPVWAIGRSFSFSIRWPPSS